MTENRFEAIYNAARESWASTTANADRQLRQAFDLIAIEGSPAQLARLERALERGLPPLNTVLTLVR